jgi:hypothetical protein
MKLSLWMLGLLTCMNLIGVNPTFADPSVSSVNVLSSASSLPIDGEGSAEMNVVKVSNLTLATDSNKGFTVTISSGNLTKTGQETPIAYRVLVVTLGANPPSSGDFTVASGNNYTYSTNQAGSQNCDLYILYTPRTMQDPGTYSANISISIIDNH